MVTGDAKETAIAIGKQIGLVSRNCAPGRNLDDHLLHKY